MIDFSSMVLPGSEVPDVTAAPSPPPAPDPILSLATDLRLMLAMRDWVYPTAFLPKGLRPDEQAKVLDAVAPDVQIALLEHPGQWFMRDQERQRFLATTPATELRRAIAPRGPSDEADPVRRALELRREPIPLNLGDTPTGVLKALGSTFVWLEANPRQGTEPSFWATELDPEGVKQRVAATLARRRRYEDVSRMTESTLRGRDTQLDRLIEWAVAPARKSHHGRFLYLSGIGGAGKSTLFAHLEKRLGSSTQQPLLVHIDCDTPGFDPTDPLALDMTLFQQLAIAQPSAAPDLIRRSRALAQAARDADATYQKRSGRRRRRGRQVKAETDQQVQSYVELESTTTQKAAERSSISDNALSQLGKRTLVLLFDTAELMLARAAVDVSTELTGTTEWLASLTGMLGGWDVRVLMAGRNPPTDQEVEALTSSVRAMSDWQVGKPIVLGDLAGPDAVALLVDLGLDATIAAKAAKRLPRTPLILKIAADVYNAGEAERAEFIAQLDSASIDPAIARRYLTERIVSHLASPVAGPYALPAMALPQVTQALLENVVLPAMGAPPNRSLATDSKRPYQSLAREVFNGLRNAGWLVREDPAGRDLTFHPEVRRLALELMASDPRNAELLKQVRRSARSYHARRQRTGDATFRNYYDLLLGEPLPANATLDTVLLGPAIEDLPRAVQKRIGQPHGAGPASSSATARRSRDAWVEYVEGTGRHDGEGDRLVKRGHAEAALELYRSRRTREKGVPPTFVLQALADGGFFDTSEVDVDAVAAEAAGAFDHRRDTLPNMLRSRIYWLTRYALMAHPGPLSETHQAVLTNAASRFSGTGPVLLFPSITAVAEAFAPDRYQISPDGWFDIEGSIESETRMFLVHHRLGRSLSWQPHLDALFVLQRDWPELAARGQSESARAMFERWMAELHTMVFPPNSLPGSQVDLNTFLRRLRLPVSIELTAKTIPSHATLLLRGLTTEFHRPLRAAIARYGNTSAGARARLIGITQDLLSELPLLTRELTEAEWYRRAGRDLGAALGLAIPHIDRARRLPSYCERLIAVVGDRKAGAEVTRVARSFLAWDRALSGGESSDWQRPTRTRASGKRASA